MYIYICICIGIGGIGIGICIGIYSLFTDRSIDRYCLIYSFVEEYWVLWVGREDELEHVETPRR